MTLVPMTVVSDETQDLFAAPQAPRREPSAVETTMDLLAQMKQGDDAALDAIFQRSIPPLQRWAHGRLPRSSRGALDTADLVQDTVISALRHLDRFEARRQGALQAYLRQAIANRIRDEIRKVQSRPVVQDPVSGIVDAAPSPLEHVIGRERLERYEKALAQLLPAEREAIIARLELQQSYEEVALALGKPTAGAARMAVTRAVRHLVAAMNEN